MDRERFEHLLDAYGADFQRWPADERAAGEAFAAQSAEAAAVLRDAQTLDSALRLAAEAPDTSALAARILATAPRRRPAFDARAALALAACAVFGIVLGYGGGMLAPLADQDDGYFTAAFEAPFGDDGDEG
jgi:ferric-dicitrate binding protein FerR (iron transport regulator)